MGVYARPDSPVYWLWLETTQTKERTDIRVGDTTAQKRDSRKLAEDRYHQRMNELAARLYKLPQARDAIRFAKYAEQYARDVIPQHRGAPRERELLKPLRAFFDDDPLTAIDPDRARAYMTARRKAVSASTVNREIDLLRSMLRDAVPKYLSVQPLIGLKRLKTIPPRRRLLTAAEERRLLAACDDAQDRAILILGIDTLMRLGDLLDLRREDRDGSWLYVRESKSGRAYEVALSPRAAAALDAIDGDGRYYFTKFRRAATPRAWGNAVRERLQTLCRRAKLPFGRKAGGISFHWATRRTGATRLLIQKGVPLTVVQRQGNWHKPAVLLEIYSEARDEDLLKAVGAPLPARSRSKRKSA